jgi:hypothetical protein
MKKVVNTFFVEEIVVDFGSESQYITRKVYELENCNYVIERGKHSFQELTKSKLNKIIKK